MTISVVRECRVRLPSRANARGGWARYATLHKEHRVIGRSIVPEGLKSMIAAGRVTHLHVQLIRFAPRTLDAHDNLPGAFKSIVDGIADAIGIDDGTSFYTWSYTQAGSKTSLCRIVFTWEDEGEGQ